MRREGVQIPIVTVYNIYTFQKVISFKKKKIILSDFLYMCPYFLLIHSFIYLYITYYVNIFKVLSQISIFFI